MKYFTYKVFLVNQGSEIDILKRQYEFKSFNYMYKESLMHNTNERRTYLMT